MEQTNTTGDLPEPEGLSESVYADYSFVTAVARIALYDDLRSAPRVTEIEPAETGSYIEALATQVYEQARQSGGQIPYTVIREVSENFIHARFKEIIVSILDRGNTIRFADQGPGISFKDKAQLPGFSSAIEPMKNYIRGVGSGLPIVKEYLEFSHGTISIEDNVGAGSVVTISVNPDMNPQELHGFEEAAKDAWHEEQTAYPLNQGNMPGQTAYPQPFQGQPYNPGYNSHPQALFGQNPASPFGGAAPRPQFATPQAPYTQQPYGLQPNAGFYPQGAGAFADPYAHPQYDPRGNAHIQMSIAALSQRERDFLPILLHEGPLGVTDLTKLTNAPSSSTYSALRKLEEAGLVEMAAAQKRILTPLGREVAASL